MQIHFTDRRLEVDRWFVNDPFRPIYFQPLQYALTLLKECFKFVITKSRIRAVPVGASIKHPGNLGMRLKHQTMLVHGPCCFRHHSGSGTSSYKHGCGDSDGRVR